MSFTAPSPTLRINSQRHYAETFYTEFRLTRPSSTEITGKVKLHLSVKSVTASIFTQIMPYRYVLLRYSYTAFHENPTNHLVVNRGLKTDRQMEDVVST